MATKPVSSLQAIVIADSFDEYFRPITLEKPRVRHVREGVLTLRMRFRGREEERIVVAAINEPFLHFLYPSIFSRPFCVA